MRTQVRLIHPGQRKINPPALPEKAAIISILWHFSRARAGAAPALSPRFLLQTGRKRDELCEHLFASVMLLSLNHAT
jgi:hypothetical protein